MTIHETIPAMVQTYPLAPDGLPGPTGRSYWVVENRFAAGAYPGKKGRRELEQVPEVIKQLLDAGIDRFVNLTQDYPGGTDGHMGHYDPGVGGRAEIVRCPVPDEHLPACPLEGDEAKEAAYRMHLTDEGCPHCPNDPSRAETRKILDRIDAALGEGQKVYVHCWGGSGRTGTIVGCWIRRHALAGHESVFPQGQRYAAISTIPFSPDQGEIALANLSLA